MQFAIHFDELNNLIEQKTGKQLNLAFVDHDTVRVSYGIPFPFLGSKDVSVNITVLGINGNDLLLAYDAGSMVNPMIKSAFPMVSGKLPAGLVTFGDNNNLVVHLDATPKSAQIFGSIVIHDIHFEPSRPVIEFSPKI